jgi:predicted transposase YbfD/YdcC
MFSTLLDRIEITNAVITADALHAQREHATYLAGRGAHYLLIIKRNQPGLYAQLAALPWREVPKAYDKLERGHGRTERRTLKVTEVAAGLAFPHAAQALQIVRRRKVKGKWSRETCYAVTSLTITQATTAQLAAIIRGHWGIEDRLHWVRDMDFGEDSSQVRTAAGPQIMASLRNLVVTILRLAGAASIAAALRYHARRPSRPLQTITRC